MNAVGSLLVSVYLYVFVRRVTAFLNFRKFHIVNNRRRQPKRGNNEDNEKPPHGVENVYYYSGKNFIARRENLSQRNRCGVDWSANERVREMNVNREIYQRRSKVFIF